MVSRTGSGSLQQPGERRTRHRRLAVALGFAAFLLALKFIAILSFAQWIASGPRKEVEAAFIAIVASLGPALLWSGVERLAPAAGSRKSFATWLLNLHIVLIFETVALIGGAVLGIATKALNQYFALGFIDLQFASTSNTFAIVAGLILSVIVGDFFYYWYHRFLHTAPFLWQLHKLHHMDEQLDAITTGRQSWIEGLTLVFFTGLPVAILFRLDDASFFDAGIAGLAIASILSLYGPFFHANMKLHLGKLSILINNPQLHRIHHSRLPQHQDRNFSNYFPPWDILFGTYYAPARDEYPPTGVDGEREIRSLPDALLTTPRGWRDLLKHPPAET